MKLTSHNVSYACDLRTLADGQICRTMKRGGFGHQNSSLSIYEQASWMRYREPVSTLCLAISAVL